MEQISTGTMKGDAKKIKDVSESQSENHPPPPPPPLWPTAQVSSQSGGVAGAHTVLYTHQVTNNYAAGGPSASAKSSTSSIGGPSPHQQDNPPPVNRYAKAMQNVKEALKSEMPQETASPFKPSGQLQLSQPQEQTPVYPQISEISLFEKGAILDDDVYNPSTSGILSKIHKVKDAQLLDLLDESKSGRFVVLVGAAGSGKTTSSIRMAKIFNKDHDKLCFRLEFKTIGYKNEITLQDLLLNSLNLRNIVRPNPNLSRIENNKQIEDTKDDAYTWTEENENHVLLIFDGYDQFAQKIKELPPKNNQASKMRVEDVVASVCGGYFLKNCRVILTSRSHALDSLPDEIKNEATTYLLHDLRDDDMKRLLKQLTGDKYEEVLKALETKAPHLKAICCNPLLLQMYARAALSDKPENITSMTRIFKNVIDSFAVSKISKIKLTNKEIKALCEVAYEAINEGSVLISEELLRNHGLDAEQVQGFIFMVPGSDKEEKVIDGTHQLYFSHQTLQEYFAARYICVHMGMEQFKDFVKTNLCNPHWFVVAQFLCGMIVDLNLSGGSQINKL